MLLATRNDGPVKRQDLLLGAVGLVLSLLIAGSQWSRLFPRADDPTILRWAVDNILTSPDWSPVLVKLFRVSYLAASHSELDAYRTATSVLTIALWWIIFVFLRLASGSRPLALLSASYFAISGFSPAAASKDVQFMIVSSLSGHLTLVFVLLAMLAVFLERSLRSYALAAILLMLATYSRPEMLLGAIAGLAMVIVQACRERKSLTWRAWLIALLPFALWAYLAWRWGLPYPSAKRSWLAFGQHAGLSFCSVYPGKCRVDVWGGWQVNIGEIFPGADSIGSALVLHPAAFVEHIARNLVLSAVNIATALFDFAGAPRNVLMAAAIALAVGLGVALSRRASRCIPVGGTSGELLVLVLAVVAPLMANWVLLYPRQHYVVVPVVALSILATCHASGRFRKRAEADALRQGVPQGSGAGAAPGHGSR